MLFPGRAGLLSIAVQSIFVLSAFNRGLDRRLAVLNVPPEVQQFLNSQRIKLAGAAVPPSVSDRLRAALKRAIADSFVDGFRSVMLISVGLALGSALIAALMLKGKRIRRGMGYGA